MIRRLAGWVFDLAALWLALSTRLLAWPRHPPRRAVDAGVPEAWWEWGSLHDTILAGPDAGAWAANVQALLSGQGLDIHRLPTFTYLAAWTTRLFDDVVFAGHFANHVISMATVALTYLWGRSTSGRAAGALAALLVAVSPDLIESQTHYGGDPATQLTVLLVIAASWWAAAGRWPWLLLAGASLGLAAATHFISLIFVPPALVLMLLARRPWWGRVLGVAIAAAVGWAAWSWMLSGYPAVTSEQVLSVFAEGAASHGRQEQGARLGFGAAVDLVLSRSEGALTMSVARGLAGLSAGTVPWGLLVALFWLGVFGPGLRRDRSRLGWDWRPAAWLLAFLAPLVALEMARAPERYALYARPLLYLAVARGAASPGAGVDALARRWWGRWPAGLVAFLPVLWLADGLVEPMKAGWNLYPPTEKGLLLRQAGAAMVERFGAGGGIATFNRDLAFHAQRTACLNVPCQGDEPAVLGQCLERIRVECPGEGAFPYAAEQRDRRGFGDQPNAALDQLVSERFEALDTWAGQEIILKVYVLERDALRALAVELAGDQLRRIPPPPPPKR